MIQITFKKNNDNKIVAFEITGHAGYADHGFDIVCAGVSALAINTVNSLEKLAQYKPIVDIEETLGGFLYCETLIDLTNKQKEITQLLFSSLEIGLSELQKNYPDFIEIINFESKQSEIK